MYIGVQTAPLGTTYSQAGFCPVIMAKISTPARKSKRFPKTAAFDLRILRINPIICVFDAGVLTVNSFLLDILSGCLYLSNSKCYRVNSR